MKKDLIYLIVILLLILGGWLGYQQHLKMMVEKDNLYKEIVLKNDSLQKISDIQSRKLVADTATIKELRRIVKDLGVELAAKPKIVEVIKFVPKEVEKPIDDVDVGVDSTKITDYYPKEEGYFIKYSNIFNNNTQLGVSTWKFKPFDISIVLSQRDDGIWQSDIKAPEFFKIDKVDIVATPLDPPKIDNFGWLLGVGYGTDLSESGNNYVRVSGGLRYKKFYVDIGANTNEQLDGAVKFEF